MIRLGSLVFCTTLAIGLLACGSSDTSPGDTSPRAPLDIVPLDNTVSGWTVDQSKNPGGQAKVATSEAGVEAFIDGGSENYFQPPSSPKTFVLQNYVNAILPSAPEGATVKLYVFEMPSEAQAKGLYTAILKRGSYASRAGMPDDWQTPTPNVGTESRIQDTSSQWWINFRKGVFYVEVLLYPSFGPPPAYDLSDSENKQEAVRFAQVIASKI